MAGVKLVENLASFTDAYGTNKNFKKRDKVAKLNPWADAGSLSRDKYFDPDPKSGSAQWKGLLDDENPDVSTNKFYRDAKTFTRPYETGFSPSDDAYAITSPPALIVFKIPKPPLTINAPVVLDVESVPSPVVHFSSYKEPVTIAAVAFQVPPEPLITVEPRNT